MGDTPAPRWWLALVGVFGIAAGAVTLLWPGITGLVLLFFIAGWAIAAGVFEIVGAIKLRKEIENEWLLIASGLLSVLFGIIDPDRFRALARSASRSLSGCSPLVYGVLLVGFALRLRKHVQIKI